MKILIVNCYDISKEGLKNIDEFELIVKNEFFFQQEFSDSDIEFYLRHRNCIDDLLYDPDSGFLKRENGMLFDHFDFVFVCGPQTLLPWSPSAQKILVLLRMCFRAKKNLFCSGFGFQALIFMVASNYTSPYIRIVNTLRGTPLNEIQKYSKNLKNLTWNDFFLDNETGDFYSFHFDSAQWIPRFNAGLHYSRAAVGAQDIVGNFSKAASNRKVTKLQITNSDEVIVYIKKLFLSHWAVQGIELQFIAKQTAKWQLHPFNFLNHDFRFWIIAESAQGPQIILFQNEKVVATQFIVDRLFPETIKPLRNFIREKLREMKSESQFEKFTSILDVNVSGSISHQALRIETKKGKKLEGLASYLRNRDPKHAGSMADLHHVGLTATKGVSFTVENNIINSTGLDKLKINKRKAREREESEEVVERESNSDEEYSFIKSPEEIKKTMRKLALNNKLMKLESDAIKERQVKTVKSNERKARNKAKTPLNKRLEIESVPSLAEIRKLILPDYNAENCPERRTVLPCLKSLKEREERNAVEIKKERVVTVVSPFRHYCAFKRHEEAKGGLREKTTKSSLERNKEPSAFSTFNFFEKATAARTPSRPILATSSLEDIPSTVQRSGPFLTEFQMSLKDQKVKIPFVPQFQTSSFIFKKKEKDKGIIGPKKFIAGGKPMSLSQNYATMSQNYAAGFSFKRPSSPLKFRLKTNPSD